MSIGELFCLPVLIIASFSAHGQDHFYAMDIVKKSSIRTLINSNCLTSQQKFHPASYRCFVS